MVEVVEYSFSWMSVCDLNVIVVYLLIVFVVKGVDIVLCLIQGCFVDDYFVICVVVVVGGQMLVGVLFYFDYCVSCYGMMGVGMMDGFFLLLFVNSVVGIVIVLNLLQVVMYGVSVNNGVMYYFMLVFQIEFDDDEVVMLVNYLSE